jgi:hypothetical protein
VPKPKPPKVHRGITKPQDLVKFGGKDPTYDGESVEKKRRRRERKAREGRTLTQEDL